jgi:hypothetical protein
MISRNSGYSTSPLPSWSTSASMPSISPLDTSRPSSCSSGWEGGGGEEGGRGVCGV